MPLITVVTAVYNGATYLKESIESVIGQVYPRIQYIVIDGGSTDGTLAILKDYSNHIDYCITEPDLGIYDAWNKALKQAKGEWICFIGADDFFIDAYVVKTIAGHLSKVGDGIKYVYGTVKYITPDKSETIDVIGEDWLKCKGQFANKMTLVHCGSFHHKSLFQSNGHFNPNFKIAGDYEFLLREFSKNKEFASFINTAVVAMRAGGISGDLKKRLIMANEMNLARRLNGQVKPSLPITLWMARIRFYLLLRKCLGSKLTNYLADLYRMLNGKRKRWSIT